MAETYELKHPGSCTGMFWRGHPKGDSEKKSGGDDWPRNGSLLVGQVHTEFETMKWLQVTKWQQAGTNSWTENCSGLWMPFEQGGLLLHKK
mmetsp:Transcript_33791/g.52867  ORF Transcript_33791/g.52867 Transcript_33791/m.52867 type:complete len:91 (-) Transcript_33791:62-334(-)|eukprot:CAMPEP_0201523244 /NCGR_PEP_ID=MMETSP0161_2-20130828/19122_1 /ASSEMBLY_ACC=CAM_ASM_000251 /TAXON_ID=180227 /ORGANISM="Neoparamoeba aestuarina, Strain SoJaBio B1-5/56/2" /LENGTH=90 /DNA_ID=CAMNT_0047922291 /DNA_START=97 /DNA_END=369 /DNA_ORIENTATION=-